MKRAGRNAYIVSYGCSSAAGNSVDGYWSALRDGRDCSRPVFQAEVAGKIPEIENRAAIPQGFRACLWAERRGTDGEVLSASDLLHAHLFIAWKKMIECLPEGWKMRIDPSSMNGRRLGIILCSTKGQIDDWIWKPSVSDEEMNRDPITPVLERFLRDAGITPSLRTTVSNACASSLSGLFLAKLWISQGRADDVVVLAADRIGPFVARGFDSLKVLTGSQVRPFSIERDGLRLGEAAAAIFLSAEVDRDRPIAWELEAVGLDAEGYSATRPSASGESLRRACLKLPLIGENPPDFVIAHGTGTQLNDSAEDRVFEGFFGRSAPRKAPVTGTKWAIGHTLGASGAMDLIAACEVIRRQEVFRLATTETVDPGFGAHYLGRFEETSLSFEAKRGWITSLGFGGIHAAASVARMQEAER